MTQQMYDMSEERRREKAKLDKISRDSIRYGTNIQDLKGVKVVKTGWVVRLQPNVEWEYVVTRAQMEGGSTGGRGGMDSDWPDALHVTIKLLNADGSYNDKAPDMQFYMNTNCYTGAIKRVWDTGKRMKKKVTFE